MGLVISPDILFTLECIVVGAVGGLLNVLLPLVANTKAMMKIKSALGLTSHSTSATLDPTKVAINMIGGGVVGWIISLSNPVPSQQFWETVLVYGYAWLAILKQLFGQAPGNGSSQPPNPHIPY